MANRNRIDIPFYKDNYVPSNATNDNECDDDIFETPNALHAKTDILPKNSRKSYIRGSS